MRSARSARPKTSVRRLANFARRLRRGLRPALRALAAHRLRMALALSGVAVGVASFLLTGALGRGASQEVERSLQSLGPNLLVVRPAPVERRVARPQIRGAATTLTPADGIALAGLDEVAAVAPGAERTLRVKAEGAALVTSVMGATPAFATVRRFRVGAGRFVEEADEREARKVAILGARVAERIFGGEGEGVDPSKAEGLVGRSLRIRGITFEIVGVLAAKGAQADGSDEDNVIVIPLRTALRRVFNVSYLSAVFVGVRDPRRMDETKAAMAALLRERHRLVRYGRTDDFDIQDRTKVLASQKEAAGTLTLLTAGLSALALLVGGIGILALLLLSVRERRSEIGLRMALGARPRDILFQFLAEATALALGGWLAGVAAGGLGVAAVALGTSWTVGLPVQALLVSLGMVLVIGIGFGAFPARQASLLPPIQALGSE